MENMWHPDEGLIHSWIDGASTDAESHSIEQHLELCESCRAMVAEARGLVAGASRIVGALDNIPGDVIPVETEKLDSVRDIRSHRPALWNRPAFRVAAGLIFVAGVSSLVLRDGDVHNRLHQSPVALPSEGTVAAPIDVPSVKAATDITIPPATGNVADSAARDLSNLELLKKEASASSRKSAERAETSAAKLPASVAQQAGRVQGQGQAQSQLQTQGLTQSQTQTVSPPPPSATVTAGITGGRSGIPVPAPPVSGNAANMEPPTRLVRLPPVITAEELRGEHVNRVERESSGCYLITVIPVDDNVRRVALADSLRGVVRLEANPAFALADAAAATARADSTGAGRGAAAGRGGAAGGGAAAAGGRAGGGGGGGGGRAGVGGGRGGGGGRAAGAATSRMLGWRVNANVLGDSLELRIAVDTTQIAVKLRAISMADSIMTGIAMAASDSLLGILGNVTAQRAQCF